MNLRIFNVQKFSLHDGPGIRTVVFFKGCPLRCKWCSNPESQCADVQLLWDKAKCVHCGACALCCPHGAITLESGAVRADSERCTGCGICVKHCTVGALSLMGEWRSLEDVVNLCLQDQPFYNESGGGVTLSGGEPLSQPDAAAALLDALSARGIHTAIETTGYAEPEVFARVCAKADLLLFDLKHWDSKRHIAGTGVDNHMILENLRHAIAMGKDVLVRIPVILGYNDALSDAEAFSVVLHEVGATRVQLLPFHQFGEKKYEMLGKQYAYAEAQALHPEDLEDYREILCSRGLEAFF